MQKTRFKGSFHWSLGWLLTLSTFCLTAEVPAISRTNPACDQEMERGDFKSASFLVSMQRCLRSFPKDEQYANATASAYLYQGDFERARAWSTKAIEIATRGNLELNNGNETNYMGTAYLLKMFAEYPLALGSGYDWTEVRTTAVAVSQLAGCPPNGVQKTNFKVDSSLSAEDKKSHCMDAFMVLVRADHSLGRKKQACIRAKWGVNNGLSRYSGFYEYTLEDIHENCLKSQ